MDGWGVFNNNKGLRYEGMWKDGSYHGNGTLFSEYEDKYVGNFFNGMKKGYGILYYLDDNSKFKGTWENGQKHGYGIFFDGDGVMRKQVWDKGELVDSVDDCG